MAPRDYSAFWKYRAYAVVGHARRRNFPLLTYQGLQRLGKAVFPVDPEADDIDGHVVYRGLAEIPYPVDAVVLETPRDETEGWVRQAADAGIRRVWIHQGRETPEAVELAASEGLKLWTGTCAVMYLSPGPSIHALHGWINRVLHRY